MGRNRNKLWKENSHKFPWLQYENIYTPSQLSALCEAFVENNQWVRTEKVDGHQMTVISGPGGGIFSKMIRIADRDDDLKYKSFQGTSLFRLTEVLEKVNNLNDEFNDRFGEDGDSGKLKTALYGEFVTDGTAQSPHDVYNYRQRGYQEGDFVCFGIGLIPDDDKFYDKLATRVRECFRFPYNMLSPCPIGFTRYIAVPMDKVLEDILVNHRILHVGVDKVDTFSNMFDHKSARKLLKREIEGFVLSGPDGVILKWKHPDELNVTHVKSAETLALFLSHIPEAANAICEMEIVCNSARDFVTLKSFKKYIPEYYVRAYDNWKEIKSGLEIGIQKGNLERKISVYNKALVKEIVEIVRLDREDTERQLEMDPFLMAELNAYVQKRLGALVKVLHFNNKNKMND